MGGDRLGEAEAEVSEGRGGSDEAGLVQESMGSVEEGGGSGSWRSEEDELESDDLRRRLPPPMAGEGRGVTPKNGRADFTRSRTGGGRRSRENVWNNSSSTREMPRAKIALNDHLSATFVVATRLIGYTIFRRLENKVLKGLSVFFSKMLELFSGRCR